MHKLNNPSVKNIKPLRGILRCVFNIYRHFTPYGGEEENYLISILFWTDARSPGYSLLIEHCILNKVFIFELLKFDNKFTLYKYMK